jgi:hypothetical protein
MRQRAKITQSIRAIGHLYHSVDLERGVQRNGKLMASDIQEQIDTLLFEPARAFSALNPAEQGRWK